MPENTCACGCGESVAEGRKWRRGHSARGESGSGRVAPFPGPGADFETLAAAAEPFGAIVDVEAPAPSPPPPGSALPTATGPGGGEAPDDEPPGHARRDWRQSRSRSQKGKSVPKMTAGLRGDINAKLSLMLEVPGQVWAARDPICGGTFVQQRPDIAAALTDIVCESADLIAFFTGPAGGFMRYLNLAVALMPVGQAVMAHHVYHSVELAPEGEPAPAQYAA